MRSAVLLVPLLLIVSFLTGCSGTQETVELEPVTVQLKWVHQAQFAGFYVAKEQGFYERENLDVTFVPTGAGIDPFDSVVQGDAVFGVGGADSIIVERASGAPIVAIATSYRINPFVLVTFADSGIRTPADFVGRTVSVSSSYGDVIQLTAMLNKVGVDPEAVNIVPYTYNHAAFLNGEIDVMNSFAAGGLLTLFDEVGDRELTLFWPGDYGVQFYSDTIFTREDLLQSDPDLVLRFLRATLQGHQYALENPDRAIDATMVYAEVQDRDVQTAMLNASAPLIHTGADEIGWMREEVWDDMHALVLQHGFIEEALNVDEVYTMEFLQEIYGAAP